MEKDWILMNAKVKQVWILLCQDKLATRIYFSASKTSANTHVMIKGIEYYTIDKISKVSSKNAYLEVIGLSSCNLWLLHATFNILMLQEVTLW